MTVNILASGGLDSTLTLFLAAKNFQHFQVIVCDYGQKSFFAERNATLLTLQRLSVGSYTFVTPKLFPDEFSVHELKGSILGGYGKPSENLNPEIKDRNKRIIASLMKPKFSFIKEGDTVILGLPKDPEIFADSQLPYYADFASEMSITIDSLLWTIGDKKECVKFCFDQDPSMISYLLNNVAIPCWMPKSNSSLLGFEPCGECHKCVGMKETLRQLKGYENEYL